MTPTKNTINTNSTKKESIRLHKWLAQLGLTSRREAESLIAEGLVTVNGKVAKIGDHVVPGMDKIKIKNKLVIDRPPSKVYLLLNKPDMCLTTRKSQDEKRNIYELPSIKKMPFLLAPVGRLDYRTTGLLIMTNDGDLAFRLISKSYHVSRSYLALVNGKLTEEQLTALRRGASLVEGPVKGIKIKQVTGQSMGKTQGTWYDITVNEGRNRLVRRLFEIYGLKVVKLDRYAFGSVYLPSDLAPGKTLILNAKQVLTLKSAVGLADA